MKIIKSPMKTHKQNKRTKCIQPGGKKFAVSNLQHALFNIACIHYMIHCFMNEFYYSCFTLLKP